MPCKFITSFVFFRLVLRPWSEWFKTESESPAVAGASHRPTFVGRRGSVLNLLTLSKDCEKKQNPLKIEFEISEGLFSWKEFDFAEIEFLEGKQKSPKEILNSRRFNSL